MTKLTQFKRISLAPAFVAALYLNAPLRAGEQVPFKGAFNPIITIKGEFETAIQVLPPFPSFPPGPSKTSKQ